MKIRLSIEKVPSVSVARPLPARDEIAWRKCGVHIALTPLAPLVVVIAPGQMTIFSDPDRPECEALPALVALELAAAGSTTTRWLVMCRATARRNSVRPNRSLDHGQTAPHPGFSTEPA